MLVTCNRQSKVLNGQVLVVIEIVEVRLSFHLESSMVREDLLDLSSTISNLLCFEERIQLFVEDSARLDESSMVVRSKDQFERVQVLRLIKSVVKC